MSTDCKPKILVVEDEALVAADLEERLIDLGYHVCGCSDNYVEALGKVEMCRPDLVLLDICLQGERDGIQVASELRQRGRVPFIYLTAYSDAPTLLRASQTRPSGYVLKPLRTRDLDAAIQIALMQNRQASSRRSPATNPLAGKRVLVLEEDQGLNRMLGRALLREGATLCEPTDAGCYDLLVAGSGFGQHLDPTQATLILTDYDCGPRQPGRVGFLSKPFTLEDFLSKAGEIVRAR